MCRVNGHEIQFFGSCSFGSMHRSCVVSKRRGRSDDTGEERIRRLREEVERLRGELRRRERDAENLQRENDHQKHQIDRLEQESTCSGSWRGRAKPAGGKPLPSPRTGGAVVGGIPGGGPVRGTAGTRAAGATHLVPTSTAQGLPPNPVKPFWRQAPTSGQGRTHLGRLRI